jgi:hypothetical protein
MRQLLFCAIGLFIFSSCMKNNPDPAWLEVNQWTLETNANSQYPTGELTHNFTDAWVYINGKVIGVFEVPFKIPVLMSGNVNIKIYPTVRNNGISATKNIYPFVEVYEINADLVANQTLTLNPTTRYFDATQFWVEDFENAALKIENDPNSMTAIGIGNDPLILKWGNFYGRIDLNSVDSTWIGYTSGEMYLPTFKEVYLEIDYYNTNAMTTGLLAISSSSIKNNDNIQLNAQAPSTVKWKKMYIYLKELVSASTTAEYFKQSFKAGLDGGDSEGFIILDNIKVVYF